ncbi:MAG: hypothetical protein ACO3AD_14515, partial [Burkholderiaceae bacterium]
RSITLMAAQDAILAGSVIAGGNTSDLGLIWADGGGADLTVIAGQRISVDGSLAAARSVKLETTQVPGPNDGQVSVWLSSAGSITAGALANDGFSGGSVRIDASAHVELGGSVLAGGALNRTETGSTIVWTDQPSEVRIQTDGQLSLGVIIEKPDGQSVEVGAAIAAWNEIWLEGGTGRQRDSGAGALSDGTGLRIPGNSRIVAGSGDALVRLSSVQDVDLFGEIVVGGQLSDRYDVRGEYVGSELVRNAGESRLEVFAELGQIRVGRELSAGLLIDLRGGRESAMSRDQYVSQCCAAAADSSRDQGGVVYGSAHLRVFEPDAQINLSSAGNVLVMPATWTHRLMADDFFEHARGDLSDDVVLALDIDLGDRMLRGTVTVLASATRDNRLVSDLLADLRSALYSTDFAVWDKARQEPTGATGRVTSDQLGVNDQGGHLMFTGFLPVTINFAESEGVERLGFVDQSATSRVSTTIAGLDASTPGSVIQLGKAGAAGGRVLIQRHVIGHDGVRFLSGSTGAGFDLGPLGILETRLGNIELRPLGDSVLQGSLIAAGPSADIIIDASRSIEVRGDLSANRNIVISAGKLVEAGVVSVRTHSSSRLTSTGAAGQITITGLNDVVINNVIGLDNPGLTSVAVTAEFGTLTVAREAGRIETGAELLLRGQNVQVEGMLRSSRATAQEDDHELRILAIQDLRVLADVRVSGSAKLSAGRDIRVDNATITAGAAGQSLTLTAGRNLSLGNVDPVAGDLAPHAVILAADRSLELRATSDLRLAADALASVSAAAGELRLVAGSMHLVGDLRAGARVDAATGNSTWSGPGALIELDASSGLTIGGPGLDPNAALTDVGATLAASGELRIATGADANDVALTLTPRSSLTSNARFDPAWTGGPSRIQVQASGLVNLEGTVRAIDSGADISIATDSLVIVDGLVSANDSLSIGAGSHHTRLGLVVKPVIASPNPGGSPRGGVLDVASGGSISLSAIDGIELSGIVGQIEAAQTLASSVSVASAAGDVSVTGSIDVKDSLTISALQIAILAGGHAEASGRDSRAFLNASQSMLLAAAQGANPLATVRAGATAHLVAPVAIVAGLVEATRTADATRPLAAERTGGQVLLHADTQLTITGLLRAQGNVALMAGADTQLPRATLEAGLALDALGEGVIEVLDAGGISAGGEFSARTGGEFRLLSAVELLGNVTMLRPAVQVVSEAVEVVRGSRDVAIGTIQRTVFTTATTTVIEKLRDVEVKIGKSYQSMEVTLTQAGYYNPSEPNPERKFREYFVEGVDYLNSQIDWSDAGSEALPNRQATAPGLTYLDTGYRTFNQLNDAQRQAVLNHLGYMPLYDLSYASGSIGGGDASVPGQVYEHTSLNTATGALTTSVKRTPTWAAAPLTIYHVDVAGWRDKYVRMPMGAQESIYRLVSQGEARYLTGDTTLNGLSDGNWQNAVNAGVIYSLPNGSGPVTTFALGTAYNGRTYANDQIDWAAYGAVAPAAGALFDTLSENQRLAVIGHLGYVRQSDPVIGEFVAEYTDRAQVKYSQVTSVYDQAATGWPTKTVVFLPGTPFELSLVVPEFNDPHDAVEDGPARWAASYVASSGQRLYRVAGRPELTLGGVTYTDTEARSPDWFWQSGPGFVTADTAPASTTYQLGRATNLLRAYPNWVTALDSDTATFTQVGTPVVRPDQVALTFKHWTDPTYFVDMWVDNDDGSQWGSQNWDDEDEVPRFSYEIFNKYSNPQQSANAGYVDGVLRLVASGHDAKYLNNNTGKWTAGTLAALTGTSGVINPATNAPYAAFAERIKATVRYAKDNDTPTGSGDGIYVTVTGQDRLNGQIKETFNDYTYQWTSKTKKVYDQRLQLNYQLTWRDQDVMGSREVWAPVTREILLPVFEDQTVWERQAVLGTEVLTRTRVGERAETLAAAGYDTVAVAARDIVIETGGPARLGGVLNATRDLRVHTLDALTVQGTTLAGAQLDSVAQLTAGQTLSLEAAGTLTLSESAFVDGRTIDLESGGRMAVAGVVGSVPRAATSSQPAHPGTLSVSIRSDAALSLDAAVYATDSIQVLAGQHAVARFGGITAGSNAQLRTTADGSDIVLRAGQSGGHLQFDGSLLSAQGLGSAIELSAESGRITQTRGAQGGATAGLLQGEVIASA